MTANAEGATKQPGGSRAEGVASVGWRSGARLRGACRSVHVVRAGGTEAQGQTHACSMTRIPPTQGATKQPRGGRRKCRMAVGSTVAGRMPLGPRGAGRGDRSTGADMRAGALLCAHARNVRARPRRPANAVRPCRWQRTAQFVASMGPSAHARLRAGTARGERCARRLAPPAPAACRSAWLPTAPEGAVALCLDQTGRQQRGRHHAPVHTQRGMPAQRRDACSTGGQVMYSRNSTDGRHRSA